MLAAKKIVTATIVQECNNAGILYPSPHAIPKRIFAEKRSHIPTNAIMAITIKVNKELHSDRD